MAFNSKPIVDNYARRSEESVRKVRDYFNMKSNFICREDIPDYGVDLNAEVLDIEGNPTTHRFGIQIKSTFKCKELLYSGLTYKVLTFPTSRLGYLSRMIPGLGLILLYEESTNKIYFDYVEDIVVSVTEMKGNEEWKNNSSINIRIKSTNVINENTVKNIHKRISDRYRNSQIKNYYPNSERTIEQNDGKVDEKLLLEILSESGPEWINNKEYNKVKYIIDLLPRKTIVNDVKILIFASLCSLELGNLFDSTYFLKLAKRKSNQFDELDKEIFSLIYPQGMFANGEITIDEFRIAIKEISNSNAPKLEMTTLNIKVNLFIIEALENVENKIFNSKYGEKLVRLLYTIEESELPKSLKVGLQITHLNTVLTYIDSYLIDTIYKATIRRNAGFDDAEEYLNNVQTYYNKILNKCNVFLDEIENYSQNSENIVYLSLIDVVKANLFINTQTNLFLIGQTLPLSNEVRDIYSKQIHLCVQAYNETIKINHLVDAVRAVRLAYEIYIFYEFIYDQKLKVVDPEVLLIRYNELIEQEPMLAADFKIDSIINFYGGDSRSELGDPDLTKLDEKGLDLFVDRYMDIYKLPIARRVNLHKDVSSNIEFQRYVNATGVKWKIYSSLNDNLTLNSIYTSPVVYSIIDEKSGKKSSKGTNILLLIKELEEKCP